MALETLAGKSVAPSFQSPMDERNARPARGPRGPSCGPGRRRTVVTTTERSSSLRRTAACAEAPSSFPGSWQHGTIPPWHRLRPEVLVYDAPRSTKRSVARQDEEAFLREGGYRDVRAIGLPIIYTQPSGLSRIPNSLLVMPTHSLASDVLMPSCERYVEEIAEIKDHFDLVAACVSAYCIARNLWVPQFAEGGIPVARGAGIADTNALNRMRALFESFEYVTTDSYGSHVFYALYFGAKVSIWGTATPVFRENILKDGGWAAYHRDGRSSLLRGNDTKWRGLPRATAGGSLESSAEL